ncbi:LCP family protein [Vagococcus salmoninarum]|nr:LCP family protein [Vagococcus salmoninarum]
MSRMERFHSEEQTGAKNEEGLNNSPQGKKPKKPKKVKEHRGSVAQSFGKLLLLIIVLLAAFSFYEYNKGIRVAKNDEDFGEIEITDFSGQKSQDGSINVLLLGSDSRGDDMGRSDSIMIAHYNKKDKTPKIVSFMRDTYANIPGYGYNKINAAYSFGGPELVRQTIKATFDIDVEYYAIVNFGSFPKVIDTLVPNGLEIDAEKDLEVEGDDIKKGLQRMDGHLALQYSRFRKDEEGDFGRVRRQQQVINGIFDQGLSLKNSHNLPEAIGKVQGYTSTNVPAKIYPGIVKDFLFGLSKPLDKLVVPVEGSWDYNSYPDAGSVLEIDESVNSQAIKNFLN